MESLTTPAVLATLALLFAPLAPWAAGAVPEGCSDAEPDAFTCRWVSTSVPVGRLEVWDVPMFEGPALATLTVVILQGPDTGWFLLVQRMEPEGDWETVSESHHSASTNAAIRHQGQSTHVLLGGPGDAFRIWFQPGEVRTAGSWVAGEGVGTFEVSYLAERLPLGVVPSRPAATADDPQVEDIFGEAAHPSWDLRAAWFDDARLGDELFDVHLRVQDLGNVTGADFLPPSAGFPVDPGYHENVQNDLTWKVSWIVEGRPYYVEWAIPRPSGALSWDALRCELLREATTEGELEEVLAHPICTVDVANGTFHATVPVSAIGSPPDGEPFQELVARTRIRFQGATDVVDDTPGGLRYHFALGGPAVWSALNPRLDPPPTPWYDDPLAPENVADTFQIGGSVIALTTFLVGLILVRRRQRQTSRLLARVDAVEEGGIDSKDILLRLGEMEQEFNGLFRRHKISDAQYQVLTQRIAGVATRFSLRRSLGLDDGDPGEQPTQGRSVPVVEKSGFKLRP